PVWTRRRFLNAAAVSGFACALPRYGTALPASFPVRFRKPNPYEALRPLIDPSHDEFTTEAGASAISHLWYRMLKTRAIPTSAGFRGSSPMPVRYREVAPGYSVAEFEK